jgi:L-ascorbate metabolism protein UlaG (beta-lactamase superfamily)
MKKLVSGMKIEFVNHSSFIIENAGLRIMCDPWLEGSVFNNGWTLISKTVFQYEDFKNINYIWFSHEHPDHFYPPNIKKIAPEHRKNITILFQYTKDKRVADYCRKQGFKEVIEMQKDEWVVLNSDMKVMCSHFQEGDSWICFNGGGLTYLNTNDCGIRNEHEAKHIISKTGKIDLLLSQFSYAYWVGNPEDKEYRQKKADEKLEWFKFQCDIFKPAITIPIASYVYFSHEENAWLNDSVNTPEKVYNYLKSTTATQPVVLYPGDVFEFSEPYDSKSSIEKYKVDYAKISNPDLYSKTVSIDTTELIKAASVFTDELNRTNSFYLKKRLYPSNIYIKDYNKAFTLSLNGLHESAKPEAECDVSITSENLLFCFNYPYGLDTTQINGRLLKPKKGNYERSYNFFRVNQLKSRGVDPNSISYLFGAVYRRVLNKMGLYRY